MTGSGNYKKTIFILLAFCWVLAGTIHSSQGIWRSGFKDYLGDESDGRLNNLLLEHGYQSLLGNYSFVSPGQFGPAEGTIAYSDMHIGTLPIYALGRSLGFSVEGTYQFWSIFICFLNSIAMLLLLRSLNTPWSLSGPLAFLGASPASLVAFTGMHIQLLPVFAFPMAIRELVLFSKEKRADRLFYSLAYFGWLHLCSPYLGFFGTIALFGLAIFALVLCRSKLLELHRESWAFNKPSVPSLLLAGGIWLIVAWMYSLYYFRFAEAGGRNWESIAAGAPDWKLWAFTPGGHWLYGDFFSWTTSSNHSEHSLFSGLAPWFSLVIGISVIARYWKKERPYWLIAFVLLSIGLVLFFTRWDDDGSGIYLWLAQHIQALTAFRAVSRSIILIHILQTLVLCESLRLLYLHSLSRTARGLLIAVAVIAAFEGLSFRQNSTPKERVQAKREGIIEAWRTAGSHPYLLFAPGPFNGPISSAHLDAWSAAMALGLKSINGYSGAVPSGYGPFCQNPNRKRAEELVKLLKLEESDYSIITSWGDAETKLNINRYDSNPEITLHGFDLQPLWWELSLPIETYPIEGNTFYQFHPKMSALFPMPERGDRIKMLLRLREGAYGPDSNSDGVTMKWFHIKDGKQSLISSTHFNPRDNPDQRGGYNLEVKLPSIPQGELLMLVNGGARADTACDWFLVGQLQVEQSRESELDQLRE